MYKNIIALFLFVEELTENILKGVATIQRGMMMNDFDYKVDVCN